MHFAPFFFVKSVLHILQNVIFAAEIFGAIVTMAPTKPLTSVKKNRTSIRENTFTIHIINQTFHHNEKVYFFVRTLALLCGKH